MSDQSSHKQILKSTGIIGGSQVFIVITSILKTKVMAVLLGPAGVGILGLYNSIIEIMRQSTSFGLNFSAVREVAESAGTNDEVRLSRTIIILRRWIILAGMIGMLGTIFLSPYLSMLTFGDTSYKKGISLMSVSLYFSAISFGQIALLQGLRKISAMANANVLGALLSLIVSIPLFYIWGIDGVIPSIILSSLITLLISWMFARRVKVNPVKVSYIETLKGGAGMIKLGLFTVFSGLVASLMMYLIRIFIMNKEGLPSVGIFQAAWSLSAVYLTTIIAAMSADYYPRLSSVNNDNKKMNVLVNEQTEIAILIAGPMIAVLITFLPVVVSILYSHKFLPAIGILRWQLFGMFFKVLAFPIGFILLAKGKGLLFVFVEILWNLMYFLIVYFSWNQLGIISTGIAFLLTYIIFVLVNLFVVFRISGFKWNINNCKSILVCVISLSVIVSTSIFKNVSFMIYLINFFVFIGLLAYSINQMNNIVNIRDLYKSIRSRLK